MLLKKFKILALFDTPEVVCNAKSEIVGAKFETILQ